MVRRRSDDGCMLTWQFPAGMVKPGSRAEHVAVSETLAETTVHCVPVRRLGSRVHPITRVICEYVLCEYVSGEARNSDAAENSTVLWVTRSKLTRLIPVAQIYPPILEELAVE